MSDQSTVLLTGVQLEMLEGAGVKHSFCCGPHEDAARAGAAEIRQAHALLMEARACIDQFHDPAFTWDTRGLIDAIDALLAGTSPPAPRRGWTPEADAASEIRTYLAMLRERDGEIDRLRKALAGRRNLTRDERLAVLGPQIAQHNDETRKGLDEVCLRGIIMMDSQSAATPRERERVGMAREIMRLRRELDEARLKALETGNAPKAPSKE